MIQNTNAGARPGVGTREVPVKVLAGASRKQVASSLGRCSKAILSRDVQRSLGLLYKEIATWRITYISHMTYMSPERITIALSVPGRKFTTRSGM
jgi:hypothetical protein